jgi:hypothetical protein
MDDGVVHVSIRGGGVYGWVEIGGFAHQTFDRVGVGFASVWGHLVKVDPGLDLVGCARRAISDSVPCRSGEDQGFRKESSEGNEAQEDMKHHGQSKRTWRALVAGRHRSEFNVFFVLVCEG